MTSSRALRDVLLQKKNKSKNPHSLKVTISFLEMVRTAIALRLYA
jgi:hypothetical protein